jgi:WD40 repeat protein
VAVWERPYIVLGTGPIERKVRVHDTETGRFVEFTHNKLVNCFAYHPDGERIVWIDADGTAILWSAKTAAVARTWTLVGSGKRAAVFTPDGRRLITGSADGAVEVWNAETGTRLMRAPAPNGAIHTLELSPDGTVLATASADGTIRLWSAPGYAPRPLDR